MGHEGVTCNGLLNVYQPHLLVCPPLPVVSYLLFYGTAPPKADIASKSLETHARQIYARLNTQLNSQSELS